MRCTKCHYLSFEPEPRCRNCGHDLSIDDPLADFFLDRDTTTGSTQRSRSAANASAGGGVATMTPPAAEVADMARTVMGPGTTSPITTELPLFVRDLIEDDDEEEEDLTPLVKVPPRPRQPLGVRRTTPDPARLRAKYTPETHEPDLLDGVDAPAPEPTSIWRLPEEPAVPATSAPVSAGLRLAAAFIDASVLGAIAATTVAFTLRLVELPLAEAMTLPVVPMVAFFAMIGLGYELMFTAANGQTIGKMLMGLRVVSDDAGAPADRVTLRQATIRAVSMLPLGAGLLAALAGQGRAVHDRVAHTRVVRV